jgi:pyrroline-5-carboxylate reductase
MKIGIIGAGNMGGAIARGLAAGNLVDAADIAVACPDRHGELESIRSSNSDIVTTTVNAEAAKNADLVIVAVKPWLLDSVMAELKPVLDFSRQMLASVVAGVPLSHLAEFGLATSDKPVVFRLIPNIAIAVHESMTFVSALNASADQIDSLTSIFDELGKTMVVEERLMAAGTALASCGIAYALRYVRAAAEGGVELGFYADQAKEIVMQTMLGAVKVLESTGNNPEVEIDKVTTPGGITIKGLNAMEAAGFTNSVIASLKASV